jgi:hypothetical protein
VTHELTIKNLRPTHALSLETFTKTDSVSVATKTGYITQLVLHNDIKYVHTFLVKLLTAQPDVELGISL